MLGITDLKTGVVFEENGQPWLVLSYEHSKMGRGGAVLRTKIKNLITGSIVEKTYKGSDKFNQVQLERKRGQYLYREGNLFSFMDTQSYDQFTLDAATVGNALDYIKEGEVIELQYYKRKPINLDLPIKVKLKVTEAEMADKGNTATAATKPIILETGLKIQAPLFIKPGDTVVVDTRTATYIERV